MEKIASAGAYHVTYEHSRRHNRQVVKVKSEGPGRHFAEHSDYNLLDENGSIIESRPIDQKAADFIIENFAARGDTESFSIYKGDLEAGRLLPRARPQVAPADVRHMVTKSEQSFTSMGNKLSAHWPIFQKLRDTGFGSIIRATMTMHQVCSSHCQYCSTISRNRADSISLAEAQAFVEKLYWDQATLNRNQFTQYNEMYRALTGSDIRLRGLILSGGGQPNLWPHFPAFVKWLGGLEVDLGLITNGFPKAVNDESYEPFTWIRISITPEDASPHYIGGRFDRQRIPEMLRNNRRLTVGYSYVYGPWTDDDILRRIADSMEENGFEYCRLLTDCNLSRSAQLRAHQALSERLYRLGYIEEDGTPRGKFFHQLKYHGTPDEARELWDTGQCFLQAYNVFWDTTGHDENGRSSCYACDSVTVLAEENTAESVNGSKRRFDASQWGTVMSDEVERLFTEPLQPFFDPRAICSSCLFMRNNEAAKTLVTMKDYSSLVVPPMQHQNFP